MRTKNSQDGITLLITLLLMGVLLGISASLMNITLKQFQFASIALSSEMAFQAASAGVECALYYDKVSDTFAVPAIATDEQVIQPSIRCMGSALVGSVDGDNGAYDDLTQNGRAIPGGQQRFRFTSWGTPALSTEVSIYKFNGGQNVTVDGVSMRNKTDAALNFCPDGAICTVVQSRGYNKAWTQRGDRTVEREIVQVY